MVQHTSRRHETLTWAIRGLFTLFGVIVLLLILGVLGIVASANLLLHPFLLVVIGIAIAVIYGMMKNPKEVK